MSNFTVRPELVEGCERFLFCIFYKKTTFSINSFYSVHILQQVQDERNETLFNVSLKIGVPLLLQQTPDEQKKAYYGERGI